MMLQPQSFAERLRITLTSNWFYAVVLLFLIVFPHLVGWITGEGPFGVGGRPRGQSLFWQSIFIELFVLAILAMSYNLMFGFTGVISFGHALFFGLGGYILGMILQMRTIASGALANPPPPAEGPLAVVVDTYNTFLYELIRFTADLGPSGGLIVGAIVGLVITGVIGFLVGLVSLRLRGVYFAIFTLALAEMAFIYVGRWQVTRAEDGFPLSDLPALFNPTNNRLFYYYFVMICAVLTFLFIRRLMNSPTGRVLLAIRENEDRAQTIGYNTLTYKLLAITIASMMAAGAGMLHVVLNKKVGPELMSVNYTLNPLLMVIIGGLGTLNGPVIGAAGLHLADRILKRTFTFSLGDAEIVLQLDRIWPLVLGSAFIIVVLLLPYGVVGSWNRFWLRLKVRVRGRPAAPPG